jgi:hypothetical protein
METFYSFTRDNQKCLHFKGIFSMKYFDSSKINGNVVFKATEIDQAKDLFLVDKNRVVKTGKTWKNSNLAKKLMKKYNFT